MSRLMHRTISILTLLSISLCGWGCQFRRVNFVRVNVHGTLEFEHALTRMRMVLFESRDGEVRPVRIREGNTVPVHGTAEYVLVAKFELREEEYFRVLPSSPWRARGAEPVTDGFISEFCRAAGLEIPDANLWESLCRISPDPGEALFPRGLRVTIRDGERVVAEVARESAEARVPSGLVGLRSWPPEICTDCCEGELEHPHEVVIKGEVFGGVFLGCRREIPFSSAVSSYTGASVRPVLRGIRPADLMDLLDGNLETEWSPE